MLKKLLISTAFLSVAVSTAALASNDNTGCGWGTMLMDGKQGVASQVLAVTTNGTSGNQTFGISSGTLGCTQDGVVKSNDKLSMYTGANMQQIASDMSKGQGESLNTMASLMGVQKQDRAHFDQVAQANFDKVFTSDKVTAGQVIQNLDHVMAADPQLAHYVS